MPNDEYTDEYVQELRDAITSQRERLGAYGEVLLNLGFDLDDLVPGDG